MTFCLKSKTKLHPYSSPQSKVVFLDPRLICTNAHTSALHHMQPRPKLVPGNLKFRRPEQETLNDSPH